MDEDGNPYEVCEDEIVLPEDPAGEQKITRDGELLGGRDFRVRTFTVLGKGKRLFMLSTEPARCMGFRDSYLLFQKHRKLYKVVADEDEKFDLIHRDIIPHSYKGRSIGLVTARSVFREFGAKIIIGGKRVKDDYYEAEALAAGFNEDMIADPDDKLPPPGEPYNKNQYVAWHGASQVYHQYTAPQVFARDPHSVAATARKVVPVTDENWMLEHARAAMMYNSFLAQQRAQNVSKGGVYEPHSGVVFCPAATQPTRALWEKTASSTKGDRKVVVEAVLRIDNPFTKTGLKDVDPEIFSDCVDSETKRAILLQQQRESEW
jgi:chromatin structure-remodeling complex protein RSC7